MQRRSQSEIRADADQPVHSSTNHEVDQSSPILPKATVPQGFRQVRDKRKVINRVSQKDCDKVFQPASKRNSQKFFGHRLVHMSQFVPSPNVFQARSMNNRSLHSLQGVYRFLLAVPPHTNGIKADEARDLRPIRMCAIESPAE